MSGQPEQHDQAEALANRVIETLGGRIVLGLPLGLGKPNHIANAIFQRAAQDKTISLNIFTALSLEKPSWSNDMERRFIEPLNERLFFDYSELDYVQALRNDRLPNNININEFFFLAGRWLSVNQAQRDYVSANYTHVGKYVLSRGINVIAHLVAKRGEGASAQYSLSSNTDITLDILPALKSRPEPFMLIGEVNENLPFMTGEAVLPAEEFDLILDGPQYRNKRLFEVVKQPVSNADHAAGLHAASLVKDGGTIQIGIGSLGDALTSSLILRHREPTLFSQTLDELSPAGCETERQTESFQTGLYGASEMFVDGFMQLYQEGILKRPASDGAILHSGFFLGTESFYSFLRDMPDEERMLFQMRGISFVNELYGEEKRKRTDRINARFMNNSMMVTLLGATISDALDDSCVVSGVGGQYNFISQAFALEGARSIIMLNSTRGNATDQRSRLIWSYGHTTIPRHLRDIVITEYGVADLYGKSDRDCIAAMLNIADSGFQEALLEKAKSVGKIEKNYRIPAPFCHNTAERIGEILEKLKKKGWCTPFPLGTQFTQDEQRLIPALQKLKNSSSSRWTMLMAMAAAFREKKPNQEEQSALVRMQLFKPSTFQQLIYSKLLLWALRNTG